MERIHLLRDIYLDVNEVELAAMRAQGAGGQNVNKVSSAIHLRFDIQRSSLPVSVRERLLESSDSRISKEGVLVIKAQQFRTQEQNREDALERLASLLREACTIRKARLATRPTLASKRRRLEQKTARSSVKNLRGRVDY